MDCSTNPKAYWSLLKTFLPCIPPLFHNIKFISNFSDNAELFSNFFAEQYTLSSNVSEIHVRLNIKTTKWYTGSILGPLLFLIYINDLSHDLASNAKLFEDDTSLFSVLENMTKSANKLNNDLTKYLGIPMENEL